jgi:hypothetical protein
MSCFQVHDFINGTTIDLPHPVDVVDPSGSRRGWDILRPNAKAESLVARHAEMLAALDSAQKAKTAIQ